MAGRIVLVPPLGLGCAGWLRQMSLGPAVQGGTRAWPGHKLVWGSGCCFAKGCASSIAALGGSSLLIQYIGTVVFELAFCCLSLFYFETSLLVPLLQISLQPNENDLVLLSGCMCLELAPGAAAQKWMSMSYLPDKALSACFFFFSCSHIFFTDFRAVLVGLQRPCAVLLIL